MIRTTFLSAILFAIRCIEFTILIIPENGAYKNNFLWPNNCKKSFLYREFYFADVGNLNMILITELIE